MSLWMRFRRSWAFKNKKYCCRLTVVVATAKTIVDYLPNPQRRKLMDPSQGAPSVAGTERVEPKVASTTQMEPLPECCQREVNKHAANNNMLVCGVCKQTLKIYRDVSSFNQYVKFSNSRGRKILTGLCGSYWIVSFPSYTTYN